MESASSLARGGQEGGTRLSRFVQSIRHRRDKGAIALLLALVTARLGFAFFVYARPSLALQNDTDRYVPIANAILSGKAYGWNTDHPGELLNTIGYPLFLAGVFLTRGHAPGDIAVAQLLISGIIVLVVYFALARALGTLPALISAILLAADPLTILWSMTILTETLFAALLGISAVLLVRWAASGNTRTLAVAGLFSGLACLVKPYAELIIAVWAVALLFFPRRPDASGIRGLTSGIGRALALIAPAVLLIAPWVVRNSVLWGCPTLSSVDRVTMRDYMAAKVVAEYEGTSLSNAQAQLQARDPGICPRDTAEYVRILLAHPQIYGKLHVAGTIPVLVGTSFDRWLEFFGIDYTLPDLFRPFMDGGIGGLAAVLREEFARYPLGLSLMFALTGYQFVIYVLAILGVSACRRIEPASSRWSMLVLVIAILILVLTPGQGGHERFRVPAQPLLILLAGYGLALKVLPLLMRLRPPRRGPSLPN